MMRDRFVLVHDCRMSSLSHPLFACPPSSFCFSPRLAPRFSSRPIHVLLCSLACFVLIRPHVMPPGYIETRRLGETLHDETTGETLPMK